MKKTYFSQEGLKLLACSTMLLDHIGATFGLSLWLRVIGRLAFPIYCFLLVEGFYHTRNCKRYALRLLVCAVLSELPYDLLFHGGWDMGNQNIMLTLLLGLAMLWCMNGIHSRLGKALIILPFCLLAYWLHVDYDSLGLSLIGLFALCRDIPHGKLLMTLGTALLFWIGGISSISLLGLRIPIQFFGIFALIPIFFYSGKKRSRSSVVQWAFYLFYPVHLFVLYLLQ